MVNFCGAFDSVPEEFVMPFQVVIDNANYQSSVQNIEHIPTRSVDSIPDSSGYVTSLHV